MLEPIQIVVSFGSGGVAGAILGHMLRVGSESASRRRAFRDFITGLEDEFVTEWKNAGLMDTDDFNKWDIFASQYASVPRFKSEVVKVTEDIRCWKKRGFRAACDDYVEYGCEACFESPPVIFERVKRERKELFNRLRKYAS
jgi:hypothetical protein